MQVLKRNTESLVSLEVTIRFTLFEFVTKPQSFIFFNIFEQKESAFSSSFFVINFNIVKILS